MFATRDRQRHAVSTFCVLMVCLALGPSRPARGQQSGIGRDVQVASLLDEIEAGTAKHERIERESAAVSDEKARLRSELRTHVRSLYKFTRPGLSPLLGGVDAVLGHVVRIKRLRRLVDSQALRLRAREAQSMTLRAEGERLAQSLASARGRLSGLEREPQPAPPGIDGLLTAQDSTYREPNDDSFYGMRLVDPAPTASFEAERGNLGSPVTGDVRIVPGQRAEGDGPGLEFRAPTGTPVRAVAAGRVAFSDRYGSYGRLVILDHGAGYYTVYGGLGAVEVRVGDDLSRQARIGSIGTDFSPNALFFEVRKGTRALDPRSWLGL